MFMKKDLSYTKLNVFYHVLKNMFFYEGKVFKSKIRFAMQPLQNPP